MPIEIKELHIKAVVSEREKQPAKSSISTEDIARLKKELTRDITEKVLRVIKQKNER